MGDAAPHYTHVADRRFADQLARATMRDQLRDPLIFAGVMIVLLCLLGMLRPVFLVGASLFTVVIVVLHVWTVADVRRRARAAAPEGNATRVRYDDVVLRLADDDAAFFIPYARIRDVRPRGRFVALRRAGAPSILLPAEVCPPVEQERVRAGIASGAIPQLDPGQFPLSAAVDRGFTRALTRRAAVMIVRNPMLLAIAAGVLVTGAFMTIAFSDPVPVVVAVAMLVVWPLLLIANIRSTARRQLGTQTIHAGFDGTHATFAREGEVARYRYGVFDRLEVAHGAAELRVAASREWQLFPLALFPPEVRGRFTASETAGARLS